VEGLLWEAQVHDAKISDKAGLKEVLRGELKEMYPRMKKVWADMGYESRQLSNWLKEELGWELDIVKHPWQAQQAGWHKEGDKKAVCLPKKPRGFQILPKRWIVERTLAWLSRFRRLSKDYEFLLPTSRALLFFSSSILTLRRIVRLRQNSTS
jgi:transposase